MFIFLNIEKLKFYGQRLSFYVFIADFATSLKVTMIKTITRKKNLGSGAEFALKMT